jgi:hypothetical protein
MFRNQNAMPLVSVPPEKFVRSVMQLQESVGVDFSNKTSIQNFIKTYKPAENWGKKLTPTNTDGDIKSIVFPCGTRLNKEK